MLWSDVRVILELWIGDRVADFGQTDGLVVWLVLGGCGRRFVGEEAWILVGALFRSTSGYYIITEQVCRLPLPSGSRQRERGCERLFDRQEMCHTL